MVSAYTRLGNLEGNPYGPNIGDTAGALKSLDKALSFAPALHVATTRDPAALQAYGFAEQSRSEVLYALGRDAESTVALQAGLRAFDTLAARPDATPDEIASAAAAYNALGDQRNRAGKDDPNDPAGSVAAYRHDLSLIDRVLKMQPNHPRARRAEALIRAKVGMMLVVVDPVGAVAELRQSIALREALPKDPRSLATNQQGEAFSYRGLGEALTEARDYRGALNAWDQALVRNRSVAAADPKDTSRIFWVAVDLMEKGLVYQQTLDVNLYPKREEDSLHRRLGIDALREAVNLFDRLIAVDPQNPTWISFQTQAQVALGTLQFGTPEAVQGERLAASALKTMRKASDSPDVPLLLLAPAVTDSLSVMPETLRDPAWTLKAAQRLNERTRYKTPAYLLALAQAYRANGDTYHAAQYATEGLALLAPTAHSTPMSRNQTLLTIELNQSNAVHGRP
jgi:tetratricopeptide (TPR) repeat protein